MAAGDYKGDREGSHDDQLMWQMNSIRQALVFLALVTAIGIVLVLGFVVAG